MWSSTYHHERPAFEKDLRPVLVSLPRRDSELWNEFDAYLNRRGLDSRLAQDNGWYPSKAAGDCAPRIVIPCSTEIGRVYWQARAMRFYTEPRYQSPITQREDAIVFVVPNRGTYNALQGWTKKVIITEGPLDALAVAGEGYTGIGLMGNKPPEVVLLRLVKMLRDSGQELYLFADSDALGEMSQVSKNLSKAGLQIRLIYMNGYKDAAAIPAKRRGAILHELTEI